MLFILISPFVVIIVLYQLYSINRKITNQQQKVAEETATIITCQIKLRYFHNPGNVDAIISVMSNVTPDDVNLRSGK